MRWRVKDKKKGRRRGGGVNEESEERLIGRSRSKE